MRIEVDHTTLYQYSGKVARSTQILRLQPVSGPYQRVLDWRVDLPARAIHIDIRHADYGNRMVGVNLDDSLDDAREFAAEAGVGFPIMHDLTKRVSRRLALLDLPTLVLVDRGGIVRQVYGRLDRKGRMALVEDIRQLLDE